MSNWVDVLLITNCFYQSHHFLLFSYLPYLPLPEDCFGKKVNLFTHLEGEEKKSPRLSAAEIWALNPKCEACGVLLGKGVTTAVPPPRSLFSSIIIKRKKLLMMTILWQG